MSQNSLSQVIGILADARQALLMAVTPLSQQLLLAQSPWQGSCTQKRRLM